MLYSPEDTRARYSLVFDTRSWVWRFDRSRRSSSADSPTRRLLTRRLCPERSPDGARQGQAVGHGYRQPPLCGGGSTATGRWVNFEPAVTMVANRWGSRKIRSRQRPFRPCSKGKSQAEKGPTRCCSIRRMDTSSMNTSLPESPRKCIECQAAESGYISTGDAVRHLIRDSRDRAPKEVVLRKLVLLRLDQLRRSGLGSLHAMGFSIPSANPPRGPGGTEGSFSGHWGPKAARLFVFRPLLGIPARAEEAR